MNSWRRFRVLVYTNSFTTLHCSRPSVLRTGFGRRTSRYGCKALSQDTRPRSAALHWNSYDVMRAASRRRFFLRKIQYQDVCHHRRGHDRLGIIWLNPHRHPRSIPSWAKAPALSCSDSRVKKTSDTTILSSCAWKSCLLHYRTVRGFPAFYRMRCRVSFVLLICRTVIL